MHPRTKPEFVSETQQNERLDEIENCCKNYVEAMTKT